ncbi:hypothetical protein EYR36_001003 [Pleurotus pulmonarius]|nr:hypothetical protein EYR36_004376 [Pleurotus pulmonarius]KAF4579193.1 hypothetical protein EYR36_001003 [Pleurotus pulmonarius]KAF4603468.1 hypothetical protein EYR38_003881 [Pleurotus pulmonarius]
MITNIASSSYNLTLSLNISSILNFPSRLLARMRKMDGALALPHNADDVMTSSTFTSLQEAMSATPIPTVNKQQILARQRPDFQPFPGPWGFFTSGYAAGLLVMAILLHRIQNVVVPPRSSELHQLHRGRNNDHQHGDSNISYGHYMLRRIYSRILPLNLSRTSTRLAAHLPSLYVLLRMLLLWTLVLLQTADMLNLPHNGEIKQSSSRTTGWQAIFDFNSWLWVQKLVLWSTAMEMETICWRTFCSVCAAFCVEALVKGLDGAGVGLTAHMNANTSPFNLVGYAFLLHIYSSPITHMNKYDGLPSRPDKHVVVTIAIPLLQLTIFHILSINKRWAHHRLLPTALSSCLSLTHFHLTLWSHPSPFSPYDRASNPPSITSYPLLNYIPNIFESLLLATSLLTITLNAITQLLLTGHIDRPLVGLGLNSGLGSSNGGWSWSPPWEEDFSVLLLRVGTASLEATGLRGLGNEVGGVHAPAPAASGIIESENYGSVGLGRMGVVWMQPGTNKEDGLAPKSEGLRRRRIGTTRPDRSRTVTHRGLSNEIRAVHSAPGSGPTSGSEPSSWWVPGIGLGAGGVGGDWRWYAEVLRFARGVWDVVKGSVLLAWAVVRRRKVARSTSRDRHSNIDAVSEGSDTRQPRHAATTEDFDTWESDVYAQFLRGEVEDDDDAEWEGSSDDGLMSDGEPETHEPEDPFSREGSVDPGQEAISLYSDWATLQHPFGRRKSSPLSPPASGRESSPVASPSAETAPVLLAHMAHTGSSPLTRRAYTNLVRVGAPSDPPTPTSRLNNRPPPDSDDSRRNCVICTVEPRQIICWPCRCLAMCDDCRESMASRSAASKHRCPCCRRTVEGYSRIFIP